MAASEDAKTNSGPPRQWQQQRSYSSLPHIASAQSHLVELFQVAKGLLHAGLQEEDADHMAACCEELSWQLVGKIAEICSDLDAEADKGPVNVDLAH